MAALERKAEQSARTKSSATQHAQALRGLEQEGVGGNTGRSRPVNTGGGSAFASAKHMLLNKEEAEAQRGRGSQREEAMRALHKVEGGDVTNRQVV